MNLSKEQLKQELANKILLLLQEITKDNFYRYYSEIEKVILPYKDEGLTKEDVLEVLNDCVKEKRYLKIDLDDYQEEVVVEIVNCLTGFCPPHRRIDW
ncbi:hypothetical protein QNI19_38580 [Cytophagaceae bacterium DM2B3-1]|uniref:Uncharacterized protein n=1 Tax=Xanthocytophaga flava TaxID=3048013 RepID=A0ABT7CYR2_9BACT|nr:hypothetical protein [Xanthocytophaga flavus]MDJ1473700.1 hypothetical protein [Xanthocytophaga flavus]MDJ1498898.1 hypothetical protein [Xanthocytophaga flavus]